MVNKMNQNSSNNLSSTTATEDKILLYARAVSGLYERMLNYAKVVTDVSPANFNDMCKLVNLVYARDDLGFDLNKRLSDGSKRENILKDLEDEYKNISLKYKELYSKALNDYFDNELEADFIGNALPDPIDQTSFKMLLDQAGERVFAQILAKAQEGNPIFELLLGKSYFLGLGTKVNTEEGLKWIRKAAESEDPEALFYAGLAEETVINDQTGVRLNPDSVKYYKASFEKGNPEAAFALYRYYQNYNNDYASIRESKKWFRRGIEENSIYCNYIDEKIPKENWAPNNLKTITDWIKAAAMFQEPDAFALLSRLYGKGHSGLIKDQEKEAQCAEYAQHLS